MTETININYIIAVLIAVLAVVGHIAWRYKRRKRFNKAADIFRNKVLSELEGLYPIPRQYKDELYPKFKESVPHIEAAAAEFRQLIPLDSRAPFDSALKEYCAQCDKVTWQSIVTFNIMTGERKPEDEGPKDIFRQKVNALLSFAKKK